MSSLTPWSAGGDGVTDFGYGVSSSSSSCFRAACFLPFFLLFLLGTAVGGVSGSGCGCVSWKSSKS